MKIAKDRGPQHDPYTHAGELHGVSRGFLEHRQVKASVEDSDDDRSNPPDGGRFSRCCCPRENRAKDQNDESEGKIESRMAINFSLKSPDNSSFGIRGARWG